MVLSERWLRNDFSKFQLKWKKKQNRRGGSLTSKEPTTAQTPRDFYEISWNGKDWGTSQRARSQLLFDSVNNRVWLGEWRAIGNLDTTPLVNSCNSIQQPMVAVPGQVEYTLSTEQRELRLRWLHSLIHCSFSKQFLNINVYQTLC